MVRNSQVTVRFSAENKLLKESNTPDRDIFLSPYFSEEKALIFAMCKFVHPEMAEAYAKELLAGKNDPFDVFRDVSANYCDNGTYSHVRLNAFIKLVHSLKVEKSLSCRNINFGCALRLNDVRAVLDCVYSSFDISGVEKLLLFCLDDRYNCCKIYEAAARNHFGCVLPADELAEVMQANSPCRFILVHSHPARKLSPSKADIEASIRVAKMATDLGSVLLEHFIVSGSCCEYRYSTLIRPMFVYRNRTFSELLCE